MEGKVITSWASRDGLRLKLKIDVSSIAESLGEPAHIAAEVLLPATVTPRAVMVCTPGGGMNRRYFDLPTPPGEPEASFAAAMAAKGFAVVMIDPLGVGESTVPKDPYLLHPDLMAATDGVAVAFLVNGLRQGTLCDDFPAFSDLRSIGVGHSFGGLLTIVQQANSPLHDALMIFGYHLIGQPEHIPPSAQGLSREEVRARLVELTRVAYPEPYLTLTPGPSKQAVSAASAMEPMLNSISLMVVVPHMIAEEAAAIKVPILAALGDKDIHKGHHTFPGFFTGSPDVTLLILPGTRHNHFIYPSRTQLFERLSRWSDSL